MESHPKALGQLEEAEVHRASRWPPSGPWSVIEATPVKWARAIGGYNRR